MKNKYTKLALEAVQQALKELPDWKLVQNLDKRDALRAHYTFKSFEDTWAFLTKVAMRSHLEAHHPEITTVYNKVQIDWTTHDVDGVSDGDVRMARRISKYARQFIT